MTFALTHYRSISLDMKYEHNLMSKVVVVVRGSRVKLQFNVHFFELNNGRNKIDAISLFLSAAAAIKIRTFRFM